MGPHGHIRPLRERETPGPGGDRRHKGNLTSGGQGRRLNTRWVGGAAPPTSALPVAAVQDVEDGGTGREAQEQGGFLQGGQAAPAAPPRRHLPHAPSSARGDGEGNPAEPLRPGPPLQAAPRPEAPPRRVGTDPRHPATARRGLKPPVATGGGAAARGEQPGLRPRPGTPHRGLARSGPAAPRTAAAPHAPSR